MLTLGEVVDGPAVGDDDRAGVAHGHADNPATVGRNEGDHARGLAGPAVGLDNRVGVNEKLAPPGRITELGAIVFDCLGHDLEDEVRSLGSARHPAGTVCDDNDKPVGNTVDGQAVLRSSPRRRGDRGDLELDLGYNERGGASSTGFRAAFFLVRASWGHCSIRCAAEADPTVVDHLRADNAVSSESMGLSLKQANAVQALARAVQDFLPGSGARQWKGHITFGTVANQVGVGEFWTNTGSKVPRLVYLLENTLVHRQQRFERLVVAIVKEGLRYRNTDGQRITADEIRIINGHILDLGFKFPELWDESFLNALTLDDVSRARSNVASMQRENELRTSDREQQLRALVGLRGDLEALFVEPDRRKAGFALEKLLNRLFDLFDLAPREPFKVIGEQIDGSFELDHEVYLLEAKWEQASLAEKELLVFRGKIEGKSSYTRGMFLAMNGITKEAETAIRVGKQPTFFIVTGHDLMMILQGARPLDDFLRRRRRLLAEEGAVAATFDRLGR